MLAKFTLHENLCILEPKHVQTIYNHHRNIKWVESYVYTTSQARVFIPSRATAKTLVQAGHVGLYEFIA